MWKKSKIVRDQGFKAGLVFGNRCPYPEGTDEARQWELGWSEGVLRRTSGSGNYRDEETAGPWHQPGLWRQLVKRFLGN